MILFAPKPRARCGGGEADGSRLVNPILKILMALVILAAPAFAAAADKAVALTARIADAGGDRIEIGLSDRVGFRVFSLTAPDRIVVDFEPLDWRIPAPRPGRDTDLVGGLRFGLNKKGGGRMVIDLRAPAAVDRAFTEAAEGTAPARFVIELSPEDPVAFEAAAGWPPGLAPEADGGALSQPDDVLVVIDPGHGGRDIGAVADGLTEATLMLAYARELAAEISRRPGYAAALTRDEDVFLTLRQRVDIAREQGGDVFLSLHADSLEQGVASGVSVYTLSEEATTEEAAALATSINRADELAGADVLAEETDVTRVLVDLAQRRTSAQSSALAEAMVDALDGRAPMLRDRAIQAAGFRVLKAPDIPSVLLELGFLSSPRDRERLLSPEGRAALVSALADGVFRWVEAQDGDRYAPARAANGG